MAMAAQAMELPNLVAALGACQSPDPAVRKAGEDALNAVSPAAAAPLGHCAACRRRPPAACRPSHLRCCFVLSPAGAAARLTDPPTAALLQCKHARGQVVNLLRVALEDSVDAPVRQVAAISFKNLVKRDWSVEGASSNLLQRRTECTAAGELQSGRRRGWRWASDVGRQLGTCAAPAHLSHFPPAVAAAAAAEGKVSPLAEEDKAAVREVMVDGVTRAPHAVRVQLGECVRSLVYSDYPQHWPGLLPQVVTYLTSQVRN